MKRLYILLTFVAILLLGVSCNKEMTGRESKTGDVTVQLSASLPLPMTKAYGEADRQYYLKYAVYKTGTKDLIASVTDNSVAFTGLVATTTVHLAIGKTYDFVFWADNGASSVYTLNTADRQINVDYSGVAVNDDSRDAFFQVKNGEKIEDNTSISGQLHRPFAQVNLGTTDYQSVKSQYSNFVTSMTVSAYSTLLLDNEDVVEVDDAVEVSFAAGAPAGEVVADATTGAPVVSGEAFPNATVGVDAYLAMGYILISDGIATVNYKFADDGGDLVERSVPNVPFQANYRTNLYGQLLTSEVPLTIEIIPAFNEPANNVYISTPAQFTAAMQNGGNYTLVEDITITEDVILSNPVSLNLNGKTLNTATKQIKANTESITVENGTITNFINNAANAFISVGDINNPSVQGSLKFSNVEINVPNATGIMPYGNADVTLENVTMTCNAYCIATNATNVDKQNINITITGGEFSSLSPIFVNVPCNLTMTDAKVNGTMHGVVARGGTVVIKGGQIHMTYNESASDASATSMANYFTNKNWGSGNTVNLAALVMGNKATNAYQYPTNVTLKGVEVACKGIHADKFPTVYIWANPAEGQGVTFKYDDATTFSGGEGIKVGKIDNVTINGVQPTAVGIQ